MLRASHRNTSKSKINEVNENLKLKSKIYQDVKTICIEERRVLRSIKSLTCSKNARFSRRLSTLVTLLSSLS